MKPIEQISKVKENLIELFGEDDAVVRAFETKEKYLDIATAFERLRNEGVKYEQALAEVSEQFYVSETTAKTAIQFRESLVNKT